MPVILKRQSETDRLLKEFMRHLWTQWDKRSVTSILHVFKTFVTRLWKCSISEHPFNSTWKEEWKLLHQTWPVWLVKILQLNLSLTLDPLQLFPNTLLQPFRSLELKKLSSKLWKRKLRPPSMVSFTIPPLLEELLARTKVKFPDFWPTSVLWHQDSTISWSMYFIFYSAN